MVRDLIDPDLSYVPSVPSLYLNQERFVSYLSKVIW